MQNSDRSRNRQLALKRQVAFVLVSLAFPDSYLDIFTNIDDGLVGEAAYAEMAAAEVGTEYLSPQTNWGKWVEVFKSIEMPILNLPNSITDAIAKEGPWTELFGVHGCWDEIAGYEIDLGRRVDDVISEGISLKEYVERFPSTPNFFTWYDRSNGYNTYGGFLVRSEGLLVSQTWIFDRKNNDFYIKTFNEHFSPLLKDAPQSLFDHIIVVYSSFLGYAYIASTDPRSWNPDAPENRIPGPLPDGYGWVDNWDWISDYEPGSLESFQSDIFTPRLQAAARYLAQCLEYQKQEFEQPSGD